MKVELPELENLYYSILCWDYFSDFSLNDEISKSIEEDKVYDTLVEPEKIDKNFEKYEKIPIKFSNAEEYIRIFQSLFLCEARAQIARSKVDEVNIKIKINSY